MKKIIIFLSIIAYAVISEGASISWGTGTAVKSVTSETNPAFGTSNAGSGTLSIYVWLVNSETYSLTSRSDIWSKYGSKLSEATVSATGKSGVTGTTIKTDGLDYSSTESTSYYGIILVGLDLDKNGIIDYYISNKAEGKVNTAGTGDSITNLAKFEGGTGGTPITGWTPVPEPTSGLLMLLGVATLALRRRRA